MVVVVVVVVPVVPVVPVVVPVEVEVLGLVTVLSDMVPEQSRFTV